MIGLSGVVAQSVERHSKVSIWCNSTDVGLNHDKSSLTSGIMWWEKILAAPSGRRIRALFKN